MRIGGTLACLLLFLTVLTGRPAAGARLRENTMPVFFDGVLHRGPYPDLGGRGSLHVKNASPDPGRELRVYVSEPNTLVYHQVASLRAGEDSLLQGLPPAQYRIVAQWGPIDPGPGVGVNFGPREYRLRRKLRVVFVPTER